MNNLILPKAVSLFSGGGGMDLGVHNAGFDILAAIEMDEHCCETLRTNIERERQETRVIEADIQTIRPGALMEELGLKPGELDLLCGGPPCQSFSQIGKQKALDDERGLLLFEMVRFARVLRPKAIFIEQVKGLAGARDMHGKRGGVLEMLLADLESAGYVPKLDLINAADYGLPQRRTRLFVVAARAPNGFQFPEQTHLPPGMSQGLFPSPAHKGIGEVLKGLGRPSPKGSERADSHVDVTPAGDQKRIAGVPEGEFLAAQKHLPPEQVGGLTRKDTTKYLRLSRKKPANTLRCGEIFFHPTENRYLTLREYMRIHGYPDSYILCGPIRGRAGAVRNLDQHRQVSNSVPPPVAEAIAMEIRKVIECRKSSARRRPRRQVRPTQNKNQAKPAVAVRRSAL